MLRAVVLVSVSLVAPAVGAATLEASKAHVTEVTVYPDRAEVVREATLEVPSGASTVEFRDIRSSRTPIRSGSAPRGWPRCWVPSSSARTPTRPRKRPRSSHSATR